MVEKKGVDPTAARNFVGLIMASNNKFVVPAGQTARRFFVLQVSAAQMQNTSYFGAIQADLEDGGYEALMHFLRTYDLTGFNVYNVPKTDALMEQKSLSRTGLDALVEALCDDGLIPCSRSRAPDVAITSGDKNGKGFWNWVRDNYQELRFMQPAAMAALLRKDWDCKRWKSNGEAGLRFPPLKDLRAKFDARHGTQDWDPEASTWSAGASDRVAGDSPDEDIRF